MSGVKSKITLFELLASPFRRPKTALRPKDTISKISYSVLDDQFSTNFGCVTGSSLSSSPTTSPRNRTYSLTSSSYRHQSPSSSDGSGSSLSLTPPNSPRDKVIELVTVLSQEALSNSNIPTPIRPLVPGPVIQKQIEALNPHLSAQIPSAATEVSAASTSNLPPIVPLLDLTSLIVTSHKPKKRMKRRKRKKDRLREHFEAQKLLLNSRTPRFIKNNEESLSSSRTGTSSDLTPKPAFQLLKTTSAPDTSRSTIPTTSSSSGEHFEEQGPLPTSRFIKNDEESLSSSRTGTSSDLTPKPAFQLLKTISAPDTSRSTIPTSSSITPPPIDRKRAFSIFSQKSKTPTKIILPVYSRNYYIDPSSEDRRVLSSIYQNLQSLLESQKNGSQKKPVLLFDKEMTPKMAVQEILTILLDLSSKGSFFFHTHSDPNDPNCSKLSLNSIIDKLTRIHAFQKHLNTNKRADIKKIILKCMLGEAADQANALCWIVKDWDLIVAPWLKPLFALKGGELELEVDLADPISYKYEAANSQFHHNILSVCEFMRQFQEENDTFSTSSIFMQNFRGLLAVVDKQNIKYQNLKEQRLEIEKAEIVRLKKPLIESQTPENQNANRRAALLAQSLDQYTTHNYTDAYFNALYTDCIKAFNPSIEMFKGFLKSVVRLAMDTHKTIPGLEDKGKEILNVLSPAASSSSTSPKVNWEDLKLTLVRFRECIVPQEVTPESSSLSGEI